jgi:elongation factor 1-alpha
MNAESLMITTIKTKFPKLFVTEITDNVIKFLPEQDNGFVEYKRTLVDCSDKKAEKYATQMRWRISENLKNQCATYFIGIDDDGSIVGLTNEEIIDCVERFVTIANSITASIVGIQIIHVNDQSIIRINVKIKKINDNYLIEFGEKF